MNEAAAAEQFELAARLRDQLITVHQMHDKQRIATTDNEDADVFGYHYEQGMLRRKSSSTCKRRQNRRPLQRPSWEDLPEFIDRHESPGAPGTCPRNNVEGYRRLNPVPTPKPKKSFPASNPIPPTPPPRSAPTPL